VGVKLTIASRIRFSRSEYNIQGHAGMDASVAFTYMDVRLKAAPYVLIFYPQTVENQSEECVLADIHLVLTVSIRNPGTRYVPGLNFRSSYDM